MNPGVPLKSKLMVSHAWREDIKGTLEALDAYFERHLGCTENVAVQFPGPGVVTIRAGALESHILEASRNYQAEIRMSTAAVSNIPLWFCTLSQYQAGDFPGDPGPTVDEQLLMDPFRSVIDMKPEHGMCVVHTRSANVYERLWCVFELYVALESNIVVRGAVDTQHVCDIVCRGTSKSANAKCGYQKDTDKITVDVMAAGGFERLDDVIRTFRCQMAAELGLCVAYNHEGDLASLSQTGELDSQVLQSIETFTDWSSVQHIEYYPS